ncbi:hypothetical protein ABFX02_10G026400 [Erythranthe guttata]
MARIFLVWCLLILVNAHLIIVAEDLLESPNTTARKLAGKHDPHSKITTTSSPSPSPSPSPSEQSLEVHENGVGVAEETVMEKGGHHNHHHSSIRKSVVGGGVILGVLAAVFVVAVLCYIRATGKKYVEPCSPSATPIRGRNNKDFSSTLDP